MNDDDAKVSARYRELSREEPPRHLDDAILAAARRAGASRPAPLVAPTGRRRWYFPVAAAAIIVLAVAVTIHVERQVRDFELAEPAAKHDAPVRDRQAAAAPKPELDRLIRREERQRPMEPPAAPPAAAGARESARADAVPKLEAEPEARAQLRGERSVEQKVTVSGLAAVSPEQWLQGIADLKRQGRNEEAEKQLAEFRNRYPDYRIPEAILEKFEKR
jgi:hypothetical protein